MVIKNTQKIESKNQIPKQEQIPPEIPPTLWELNPTYQEHWKMNKGTNFQIGGNTPISFLMEYHLNTPKVGTLTYINTTKIPPMFHGHKKRNHKITCNSFIISALRLRFKMGLNQRPPD
jgi:hypothetical protein